MPGLGQDVRLFRAEIVQILRCHGRAAAAQPIDHVRLILVLKKPAVEVPPAFRPGIALPVALLHRLEVEAGVGDLLARLRAQAGRLGHLVKEQETRVEVPVAVHDGGDDVGALQQVQTCQVGQSVQVHGQLGGDAPGLLGHDERGDFAQTPTGLPEIGQRLREDAVRREPQP